VHLGVKNFCFSAENDWLKTNRAQHMPLMGINMNMVDFCFLPTHPQNTDTIAGQKRSELGQGNILALTENFTAWRKRIGIFIIPVTVSQ
jgi:hypothetical protein